MGDSPESRINNLLAPTEHRTRYHPGLGKVLFPVENQTPKHIRILRGAIVDLCRIVVNIVQLPGIIAARLAHPSSLPVALADGALVKELPAVDVRVLVVDAAPGVVGGGEVRNPRLASRQANLAAAERVSRMGDAGEGEDGGEDVHDGGEGVGNGTWGWAESRIADDAGAADTALGNP